VGLALVLSDTRGVWVAAIVAGFYLLWSWRKWAAMAMPAILAIGLLLAPAAIQQRAKSIIRPEKVTDSNTHRIICWRTGWQMIKAHPLVGVGPDRIKQDSVFFAYLPGDIPRPLPPGFYQHLHSIYVQYAAERGIPAALLITGAMVMALWDFRRALRRLPPGRSNARFLLQASNAFIIGAMVSGISEYNLNDTEVLTMFLAMMCAGYLAANPASE
jgi:O-antigen ligase